MATLHQTVSLDINAQKSQFASNSKTWLERLEQKSEFNRYGIISMLFLLIGILGGITIAVSAYAHLWQISTIAILTMLSLSLMLAVAPMKYIIRVTAAALILDLFILVLNMFM